MQLTQHQSDMFFTSFLILEAVYYELSPLGGEGGGSYKFYGQQIFL
jgi:hypothetical protein